MLSGQSSQCHMTMPLGYRVEFQQPSQQLSSPLHKGATVTGYSHVIFPKLMPLPSHQHMHTDTQQSVLSTTTRMMPLDAMDGSTQALEHKPLQHICPIYIYLKISRHSYMHLYSMAPFGNLSTTLIHSCHI